MPIQTGELSLCAFTREVYARLGRDIVLALPMKAAATTHQQWTSVDGSDATSKMMAMGAPF